MTNGTSSDAGDIRRSPARGSPPVLRLSARAFDSLAAGTDQGEASRVLWRSEQNRRRLLLRALLDHGRAASGSDGPLPPLDVAWDLLEVAEDRAPDEVHAVLAHPPVGRWAARTLSRLLGLAHSDTPLWVDLGYLHTVAAAAAVRAGVDFILPVPVRHRVLVLPTVGSGDLPTRHVWSAVTLHHERGRLRGAPDHPLCSDAARASETWRPARTLRVTVNGLVLTAPLEDADPFRHSSAPTRPVRLSAESARRWESMLTGAWKILVDRFPRQAAVLTRTPLLLAPLPGRGRFRLNSASSGDAVGAVSLSEPDNETWLAETLLHELQHARLGALLRMVELLEPRPGPTGYAPWRDDPRPLKGMLHGIVAFLEVAEFWRVSRTVVSARARTHADFEFALARGQVAEALRQVRDHPDLTRAGHRFAAGLALRVDGMLGEPVAVEAGNLAGLARDAHRIRWRLRHKDRRPDGGDGPASARAGGPWAAPPALLHGVTELCRLWLLDQGDFLRRASRASDTRTGVLAADWRLVAGDLRNARDGYAELLRANPADERAHAGLSACLASLEEQPAPCRDDAVVRPGTGLTDRGADRSG